MKIGLLSLLGIVFIVQKLTHAITWSWWWVTVPFWGPVALVGAIAAVGFGGYLLYRMLCWSVGTLCQLSSASMIDPELKQ